MGRREQGARMGETMTSQEIAQIFALAAVIDLCIDKTFVEMQTHEAIDQQLIHASKLSKNFAAFVVGTLDARGGPIPDPVGRAQYATVLMGVQLGVKIAELRAAMKQSLAHPIAAP